LEATPPTTKEKQPHSGALWSEAFIFSNKTHTLSQTWRLWVAVLQKHQVQKNLKTWLVNIYYCFMGSLLMPAAHRHTRTFACWNSSNVSH